MTKADAPFSSIFFGLGLIFIMGTYYHHYVGTYYDGEELSYYTDTLREKPSFINRRKSSDYYQFQLSYSKSKFIIVDNGCSIILNDKSKLEVVNSLNTGDVVILGYPINVEDLTRANQDKVKAITLAKTDKTILSVEEVLQADKNEKRKYYLIGLGLILCGFISLYLRKRNSHK
jgi:hypothetical protein